MGEAAVMEMGLSGNFILAAQFSMNLKRRVYFKKRTKQNHSTVFYIRNQVNLYIIFQGDNQDRANSV